jgi:hypothetical protein
MSRTRSINTDTPYNVMLQTSSNGGVSWSTPSANTVRPQDAAAKTMTDEVTPRFKVRQGQGEIVMNALTSMSSDIKRSGIYNFNFRKENKTTGVFESGYAGRVVSGNNTSWFRHTRIPIPEMVGSALTAELAAFGLPDATLSSTEQLVLADALEKATSSQALALVTLAELDKTVELLASAGRAINGMCVVLESLGPTRVRQLNELLRKLKGMSRLSRKQLIKQLLRSANKQVAGAASAWLGYRYGVMATIYDMESWVNASQSGRKRARFVGTRQSTYVPSIQTSTWNNYDGNPLWGTSSSRLERRRTTHTSAGVLVGMEALSGANRFGVNRLASTAWELIPFSFVLDWLVDAGTRLSAMEGQFFVQPLGSWITHEHHLYYSYSMQMNGDGGGVTATSRYIPSGMDAQTTVENCVYRVRIPNPRLLPMPQVKVNLNWKRLADSAALLTVLTTRFRKAALR